MENLLDPSLGLLTRLPGRVHSPELIDGPLINKAKSGIDGILRATRAAASARTVAEESADIVRAADTASSLQAMDLEVLKKASPDRLRLTALHNAGLNNVWKVLKPTTEAQARCPDTPDGSDQQRAGPPTPH